MRVARDLLPESAVEGMCSHARRAAETRAIEEAQRILEEALGGRATFKEDTDDPDPEVDPLEPLVPLEPLAPQEPLVPLEPLDPAGAEGGCRHAKKGAGGAKEATEAGGRKAAEKKTTEQLAAGKGEAEYKGELERLQVRPLV
jgi:hypothetical protein